MADNSGGVGTPGRTPPDLLNYRELYEEAYHAAIRQARIFEPSMDGYAGALAVVNAAFGGRGIDGAAAIHVADLSARMGQSVAPGTGETQLLRESENAGTDLEGSTGKPSAGCVAELPPGALSATSDVPTRANSVLPSNKNVLAGTGETPHPPLMQLRQTIAEMQAATQVRESPRDGPGKHRRAAERREVETIHKTLNVVLEEIDKLAGVVPPHASHPPMLDPDQIAGLVRPFGLIVGVTSAGIVKLYEQPEPLTAPPAIPQGADRIVCASCGAVHTCVPPAVCSRAMFDAQEAERAKDGDLYGTAYQRGQEAAEQSLAALRDGLRATIAGWENSGDNAQENARAEEDGGSTNWQSLAEAHERAGTLHRCAKQLAVVLAASTDQHTETPDTRLRDGLRRVIASWFAISPDHAGAQQLEKLLDSIGKS